MVVLALLSIRGLHILNRMAVIRLEKIIAETGRLARLKTLLQVGQNATFALVILFACLIILNLLGINIIPLLAGAGVIGLAVSLGAQTLVKDFIGGILILVENWYALGDTIQIGDFSGTVEKITLRATYLRNVDGRLHLIPNGEVRSITNISIDWSAANVDLKFPYGVDMAAVQNALQKAVDRLISDTSSQSDLLEAPRILGWFALGDWSVQVRLTARTRPGRQLDVSAALRRFSIEALHDQGIQPGVPRQWMDPTKDI